MNCELQDWLYKINKNYQKHKNKVRRYFFQVREQLIPVINIRLGTKTLQAWSIQNSGCQHRRS